MKLIGISQRVTTDNKYGETRDALDTRWTDFCQECGLLPLLLPSSWPVTAHLLNKFPVEGIILTGGGSLGETPARDEMELALLEQAMALKLPLLGVCRGMQLIQSFWKVPLEAVKGHVRTHPTISWEGRQRTINSYHNLGTSSTAPELTVLAQSDDGIIKAIQHKELPITGIMWHPERNSPFDVEDKKLLKRIFG
jgi:gamma-glutamyl-gamma-aminobutyrate hydrolase PuuD